MLRIKDPKVSVPFYENHFGFKLIHTYDFPQWNFSLYFLAILPAGQDYPTPGTPESEKFLWSMKHVCLELTHNYGSENDPEFKVNNGNVEPFRGFGHLAVMTSSIETRCAELEAAGVRFQKRLTDGRMKNIAFALDPDGYWIEIIHRESDTSALPENYQSIFNNNIAPLKYTLAQTMFRVKDPQRSLSFYRDLLGMTLLRECHFGPESGDFSLYFLAHLSEEEKQLFESSGIDPNSPESGDFIRQIFAPVIELTHNHGTEDKREFKYHNGNDQDAGQLRGFGHTGFLVDNLDEACAYLEDKGVSFKKKPSDGNMRGLAFAYDPDNYWVEIIQKDGLRM